MDADMVQRAAVVLAREDGYADPEREAKHFREAAERVLAAAFGLPTNDADRGRLQAIGD